MQIEKKHFDVDYFESYFLNNEEKENKQDNQPQADLILNKLPSRSPLKCISQHNNKVRVISYPLNSYRNTNIFSAAKAKGHI